MQEVHIAQVYCDDDAKLSFVQNLCTRQKVERSVLALI